MGAHEFIEEKCGQVEVRLSEMKRMQATRINLLMFFHYFVYVHVNRMDGCQHPCLIQIPFFSQQISEYNNMQLILWKIFTFNQHLFHCKTHSTQSKMIFLQQISQHIQILIRLKKILYHRHQNGVSCSRSPQFQ